MNNQNNNDLFSQMFGVDGEARSTTPPQDTTPTTSSSNTAPNIPAGAAQPMQPMNNPGVSPFPEMPTPISNPNLAPQISSEPVQVQDDFYTRQTINNNINPEPVIKDNGDKGAIMIILILIGVISLIFVGGWFYKTVLNPVEKTQTEEKQEEKENKPAEPEQKPTPTPEIVIDFNQDLSFYYGLTTDTTELNQKKAYNPVAPTGVIKCSTVNPVIVNNATTHHDMYLYYENYQLKKSIDISTMKFKSSADFKTQKDAFLLMESVFNSAGYNQITKINSQSLTIQTNILVDLAYGNYFATPDQSLKFKLLYDYNENIKDAMDIGLTKGTYGKYSTCSTVDNGQNTEQTV